MEENSNSESKSVEEKFGPRENVGSYTYVDDEPGVVSEDDSDNSACNNDVNDTVPSSVSTANGDLLDRDLGPSSVQSSKPVIGQRF